MVQYILLAIGFYILVKGADLLVNGAVSIADRFKLSNLVIGMTVVAFGTSAPELFVSVSAAFKGTTDIAIGNVLGSNISNILLILGAASLIYPLTITRNTIRKDIPFSLLAVVIMSCLANEFFTGKGLNRLDTVDGIILLGFFIGFIYYTLRVAKDASLVQKNIPEKKRGPLMAVGLVMIGLVGLGLGGNLIVNSAIYIASRFGLSESFVGLTIVAIGTSLPELAASAVAAYKRNPDIAVGNVLGSNIFNIFLVLGASSILKPLPLNPINNVDIAVAACASVILLAAVFIGRKGKLDRWEGAVFVCLYITYLVYLLKRG